MNRKHAFLISVGAALALVVGSAAALRTTELGTGSGSIQVSDAQFAERRAQLDRAAASLRRQARKRPPALPAVRAAAAAPATALVSVAAAPPATTVDDEGDREETGGDRGREGEGDDD